MLSQHLWIALLGIITSSTVVLFYIYFKFIFIEGQLLTEFCCFLSNLNINQL